MDRKNQVIGADGIGKGEMSRTGGCCARWFRRGALLLLVAIGLYSTLHAQFTKMQLPRAPHFYNINDRSWDFLATMEWSDSLTGYVFEYNGTFYKTVNGGDTWARDSLPVPAGWLVYRGFQVQHCDFATKDFGVVTLGFSKFPRADSVMVITTDGGESWTIRNIEVPYVRGRTSTNVIPERNGAIIYCGGGLVKNTEGRNKGLEYMARSTDLGRSWDIFSRDTLKGEWPWGDYALTTDWLYADSLRTYRFTFQDGPDYYDAYVKATADGGRNWQILNAEDAAHPLHIIAVGGRKHMAIHRMNDTGLVVVMGPSKSVSTSPVGQVTKDIRYQDTTLGWLRVEAGRKGQLMFDMAYIDGWLYYWTLGGISPPGWKDTLWVSHVAGEGKLFGFEIPTNGEFGLFQGQCELHTPTANRIFCWSRFGGVWRFDASLVGIDDNGLPPQPTKTSTGYYPQPLFRDTQSLVRINIGGAANKSASLAIYDLLGRQILNRSLAPSSFRDGILEIPSSLLDRSALKNGIYLTEITIDGLVHSFNKLIIQ